MPSGRANGSALSNDSDASDEDEDEDEDEEDDDDEAYVTSNDYATTPERRGGGSHAKKVDWKGKGKARASYGEQALEHGPGNRLAEHAAFGDAADDEDLYGDS